jgi:hypothetical protein
MTEPLRVCVTSGRNAATRLRHAVRAGAARAVCTTKPGRTATWETVEARVSCPRCLKRLAPAPGTKP